jgi:hypothetical protein
MKKLLLILFTSIILMGLNGCTKCDPCNCSSKLNSSINCLGTTQSNSGCNNATLNSCGYCYLHTDQCCNNN